MELKQIKSKIQDKIIRGDFITLGKCLNIPSNTASVQYKRSNKEAVLTMQKIIKNREKIIKEIQKTINKKRELR